MENDLMERGLKVIKKEMKKKKDVVFDEKNVQTDAIVNQSVERESTTTKETETFACNLCQHSFNNISDLKTHKKIFHGSAEKNLLKSQLLKTKCELSSEKLNLSFKLALLKEKEMKQNSACNCRSFCRIFHPKHNWKKSKSDELAQRMNDLQSSLL